MIPEINTEMRIKVGEEPQWFLELRRDSTNIIYTGYRFSMTVHQLGEVYFVVHADTDQILEDYYIYVKDEVGAKQSIDGDRSEEANAERFEEMAEDRDYDAVDFNDCYDDEW